jgi:hypothetical protein
MPRGSRPVGRCCDCRTPHEKFKLRLWCVCYSALAKRTRRWRSTCLPPQVLPHGGLTFAPITVAPIRVADEWRATGRIHEQHDGPLLGP